MFARLLTVDPPSSYSITHTLGAVESIGADCITYGMESRKSNSLLVKLALCDRRLLVIRPFAEGDLTAGIRSRHSSSIQTILRLINEIVTYSEISYRNRDAFLRDSGARIYASGQTETDRY